MLLKGKHIFLIEDDPVNFAVLQTILKAQGAFVLHDHWGDTTLYNMVNYPYELDMIIIDLMLPGDVTGYDIFDAIKNEPKLKDIITVIVSASDPDIEIPQAQEKGFTSFISKPVNRGKLPQQLLNIMEGKSIWE